MLKIAGSLDLVNVMATLASARPIFHSEADFQFAFAQVLTAIDAGMQVRLEVRQAADRAEYVDLACWTGRGRTLIEFKYATRTWTGTDHAGETYLVRNHAAFDLTRRYFIHDVTRLERFVTDQPDTNGLAILLTNEPSLWNPPTRPDTRDAAFRLHEGRTLTGHLVWGTGDHPSSDHNLAETYTPRWHDYSTLTDPPSRLRWLAIEVTNPGDESVAGSPGEETLSP